MSIIDAKPANGSTRVKTCLICQESIGLTEQHVAVIGFDEATKGKYRGCICHGCAVEHDDEKVKAAARTLWGKVGEKWYSTVDGEYLEGDDDG